METCCCAQAYSPCGKRPVYEADDAIFGWQETCIAVLPGLCCRNAVCRVACLAWARWIGELKHQGPRPGSACDSLETLPAKEDKRRRDCCGNHLGCPFSWGLGRIAVRTKWQSGITTRQRRDAAPKGKPPDRRREACCGENQPVPKPQDLLPELPCSVFDFDRPKHLRRFEMRFFHLEQ